MIEWGLLGSAIRFYETKRGYNYVEVPWMVAPEIARQTFPGEPLWCGDEALIGSAEQGFLALEIEPGAKLVACSPCFRNEPTVDELHRRWFMKVELYREGHHLDAVLDDALAFFDVDEPEILGTADGVDLLINGVEIGSYGERTVGGRQWTYGTGLALPRYHVAIASKDRVRLG